jgi:hypothetical protein
MAKLKIKQTDSSGQAHDSFVSPTLINGNHYGGVGGSTSQSGLQIKPTVFVNGSAAAGSILAQKGAHKFRVTDGTNTGTCTLTNAVDASLTAGQMNLWANVCIIPSAAMAAANVAGGATSTYVTWTAGATIGPVSTPRVGDYITGFTSSSVGASGAQVTAVNTASNVTVALTGNVAASTVLANTMTLVSRISNKFISDFISDGTPDSTSGTVTYYSSGNNPTKFRYVLGGNATAQFARVISG